MAERSFLLGLLTNQNLLEHEEFTDLLWATFHLLEELTYRHDFSRLPKSDLDHLVGDLNRVYALLICRLLVLGELRLLSSALSGASLCHRLLAAEYLDGVEAGDVPIYKGR